jgi:hypothetical protein
MRRLLWAGEIGNVNAAYNGFDIATLSQEPEAGGLTAVFRSPCQTAELRRFKITA